MDLSESMIRYYLDSITVSYFNHNELPPDDVKGYYDQVLALKRKAVSHGDLDSLKVAFEYLLSHRELDCGRLGDDRYPYSDEEIREIIRYAWHTIWPETSDAAPAVHPDVRLVQMPLEDWWEARRGASR
jgi:hypothetical protein